MLRTGSSSLPRRCLQAGLALAVALAGLSVAVPAATAATTLIVSTTADISTDAGACGDVGITTAPTPLSLREATCLANNIGGDVTINVPAGSYHLTDGELRLGAGSGQHTTLIGNQDGRVGTVIDAGGLSRVLELDFNLTGGVDTTISGLTLTGGNDDTYGGAGIIAGSGNSDTLDNLTISNSWIIGNQTSPGASYLPGGAVQFIGGSLTISNSTISNNSSGDSSGGGVFYQAQGVAAGEGLTITGSTFTGNSAGTADGGAIAADGGSAVLHYNRLTGNTAASGSAVSSAVGAGVDATENWWGCNTGPGGSGCDSVAGGPTVSPRLVLSASANPATVIGPNGVSTVTATLTQDSLGSAVDPQQLGAFGGLSVSWTDPQPAGATVSAPASYLSAGSATTTYNSHAATGAGHVLATLDQGTATATLTIVAGQAPSVTLNPADQTVGVGASVSFSAAASGVPTPTVQWQRSIDGGVSFANITGATSTTYTFTATAGDDGNQYRAVFSNAAGTASSIAATLSVGSAPAFTSADHTSFVAGQAGSFMITTTGQPSAALSRTGTQFPAWLTLTDNGDGTGALTGTPPAGSAGTYQFTLKAANGFSPSASQVFTLFVDDSPVITSVNHTSFVVGQAGSFAVTTTAGFPVATRLTETGSLPSGVTLHDNGDGTATLAGTPAAGTGGSYPITIAAATAGGLAPAATQAFTLTVQAPPVITSANHATFSAGSAGSFTVTTTAGNPATTTLTKSGVLPAGVTFTDNGDGTATIAGTPNVGSQGVYTITITASNGVAADATQTFTLTVNAPPVITSANHATFTVNAAAAFTVTTTSSPTASLSESGSLPSGMSFTDNGDGTATVAGTPSTGGSFSFTITASNGVLPNATQAFTATVNASPSITSADHTTFAVGSASSFTVTTTPGVPASTTITESGSLPAGVSFTDNGDGTATLAGTPAAGRGGSYAVTFTASNGVLPNSAQTFTLTVTELPAITSANHTTLTVNSAASFTVTTVAGYPTATTLTETGSLPSGMSFTDNGDGSATLAGTPAAGTGGTYPLTLTATNAVGHVNQAFTLTVTASALIASADHTTFTVGSAGTFTVTTSPAPTSITESGALPSGVTFHDNGDGTGTLAGTPAVGQGGSYSITFTASNGVPPNAVQNFMLTVTEVPVFTSANHGSFVTGSAGAFTVTSRAGFPTATTLTETGTLPPGLTFTDNGDGTATLAGTPAAFAGGSYVLTLTATNSTGHTDQAFTVTVGASPSITSSNSTTFTVNVTGSFTVTTSGGFPTPPALTESGALPGGVTFHDNGNGTATLSGKPTASGVFTLTFTANNGVAPATTQSFTLTVNGPPVITSANNMTSTANAAGSFTVTTQAGYPAVTTLTESGALPSGISFTDNGNGTATLAGTPTTAGGKYSLTLTAANSIGNTTQTFTLTVNAPPVITSVNNTTFTQSQAGTYTVRTSGYPRPTLTETGTLPAGVTFTDNRIGTATLAGTPTNYGTFTFTVKADNGLAPAASQSFTLTVNIAPVAVKFFPTQTGIAGTAINSLTMTASGGIAPYTWSATGLPPGMAINASSGVISGTPTTGGNYVSTVTAKDSTKVTGSEDVRWLIGTPGSVIVTNPGNQTGLVGNSVNLTLQASGDFAPYTWSVTGLPSGVTLEANTWLQGNLWVAGTYHVRITATDDTGVTGSASFTWTVNTSPFTVNNPGNQTGAVGTRENRALTASGGTGPYTWSAAGLPPGLAMGSSGGINGIPTTAGTYSVTVTGTDANSATRSVSFSWYISPMQIADPGTQQWEISAPVNLQMQLLVNGSAPYTWSATQLPTGVTISATTGLISGTPTSNDPQPPQGPTVSVTDSTGAKASFTLTEQLAKSVQFMSSVPSPSLVVGQSYQRQLTVTDGSAPYTFTATNLPPGFSISAGGLISGAGTTPGTYAVTVVVTDSLGGMDSSSGTWKVT